MKDNLQNIADLIGALAEDIEEIKKILATKDAPDKDEAVKKACVGSGACHTFLWRQHAGEHQRHFREQGSHRGQQKVIGR